MFFSKPSTLGNASRRTFFFEELGVRNSLSSPVREVVYDVKGVDVKATKDQITGCYKLVDSLDYTCAEYRNTAAQIHWKPSYEKLLWHSRANCKTHLAICKC